MSKENECTIVTAYFEFPLKKHTTNSYLNWINNFLPNTNAYMVIFTDEQSYNIMYNLRKKHLDRTRIIILKLTDFYCYKYMDYWNKDHARDHEKLYHHQYLYMIWSEKSNFIKLAIEMNPFDTEFYMWCDIGMIRDTNCIQYITNFPNKETIKNLKRDKVYLLNLTEFSKDDLKITDATEFFRYQNNDVRIGGGGIFGNIPALKQWIKLYYEMLDEFMKRDYFAGKDQSIMTCVYLKNRDFIELVKHKPCPFNHWFYMIYFLC